MLKIIPKNLSPELLKILMEMGHGDEIVIGDVTQAAYLGPWLWKAAVEKAGSFDIDKVREASPDIELTTAPEGYVRIAGSYRVALTSSSPARESGTPGCRQSPVCRRHRAR